MATIDMSPEAVLRLLQRLQREYGETSCSNFALDEQLNAALAEKEQLLAMLRDKEKVIAEKNEIIAAQVNSRRQTELDNESLRCQLDEKRAARFGKKSERGMNCGADQDSTKDANPSGLDSSVTP